MKVDNNNINKEISLKIKYEKAYKIIRIDESSLNNYDKIFKKISKFICSKENIDLKDLKALEICLTHPEKENIKINNTVEWNLFYDCGIINDYIIEDIKKNKKFLNIEYNIIKNNENNEIIDENNDLKNEVISIMEKIPNYFYSNSVLKFFLIHKEIGDKFKLFFFEELMKAKLDNIEKDIENINNKYSKDNYPIKTYDFLNILKNNQITTIIRNTNSLKSIRSIIDDDDENNFFKTDINFIDDDNQKKINILSNSDIENEKIFLSHNISKKTDINKYFDENNYFRKCSKEDYDNEIYSIKEDLNSEIIKNINNNDKDK